MYTGKIKSHYLLSSLFKMKPKNPFKFAILSIVLLLAMGLYNCKPVPSEPEVPKFDDKYTDVKLPEINLPDPEEVISTPATVNSSAAMDSIAADLATGKVTPGVIAAIGAVQKVVSAAEATKLVDALTPEILSSLSNGGSLPADLQASMLAIANNPALAAYMPTLTLPTVDGKVITGFVKETPAKNNEGVIGNPDFSVAAIHSPCADSARAAYNRAKATLDAAKTAQDLIVTTYYDKLVDAATKNTEQRKALIRAEILSFKTKATKGHAGELAYYEAHKENYDSFRLVILMASYTQAMKLYDNAEKVAISAIDTEVAAKIAYALKVRNTNLPTIQANYNTQIAAMQATLTASYGTCHDQGQG